MAIYTVSDWSWSGVRYVYQTMRAAYQAAHRETRIARRMADPRWNATITRTFDGAKMEYRVNPITRAVLADGTIA